ncbi:hypothetical protein ACFC06_25165 [Nocardia sp. NPDC056064]|uniref:NucA/NucB deoxyribonuclease domain-containing protein n=1 Tax=Nocardia sp. NPDC056064 TaxID=3345701 RepID=UPI0035E33BD1
MDLAMLSGFAGGGQWLRAGCVVQGAEPTIDMTARNVTAHAGHIGYAQSSGLPGKPNGTPLTRTTDEPAVQNNRNTTCNRVPGPRPPGQQCDEYPFASTRDGGGGGGPARAYGRVRTDPCAQEKIPASIRMLPIPVPYFDGQGIDMCLMPGRDSMRGGGILSWFYLKNRALDGDQFYVKGL